MIRWAILMMSVLLKLSLCDCTSVGSLHIVENPDHNPEAEKLLNKIRYVARSCKELKENYNVSSDGLYFLTTANSLMYEAYCDMTTAGGGWTLVASVHENNMYGKCTLGDRWSSQQGSNPNRPAGDGTWSNKVTFGSPEAATSDDYKSPGYYGITAEDMSVWHVRNNAEMKDWRANSILRYHTETSFLTLQGGNLYQLFKQHPVRNHAGACKTGSGPSVPIVYDLGDAETTANLYGPYSRVTGDIASPMQPPNLRVVITTRSPQTLAQQDANLPKNYGIPTVFLPMYHPPVQYCIGGGGYWPEGAPRQCGDFSSFDWDGYGTNTGWSASRDVTESAVLLFYR